MRGSPSVSYKQQARSCRNNARFCQVKRKEGVSAAHPSRIIESLDSSRGACVDTCAAFGADIGVDDCDVSDCDGGRGALVCAYSACYALCFVDLGHLVYLGEQIDFSFIIYVPARVHCFLSGSDHSSPFPPKPWRRSSLYLALASSLFFFCRQESISLRIASISSTTVSGSFGLAFLR